MSNNNINMVTRTMKLNWKIMVSTWFFYKSDDFQNIGDWIIYNLSNA